MSDVIKLLPDSVANQIAAGEVIQRPASVIKELVENAVDAQATCIEVVLKDAGRTLIQVVDDGVGMTATDARLAFERHSTSKIAVAQDLFSLRTMGFRGEALASIAAIAHVELRTTARGADLGTRLLISGSQCELQEPAVTPPGCNFMIKDLFYNVPARRKFLKSNQVELSNIVKEMEKLALINHDIELSLTHNGNAMYHLLPGTLKQRIVALWGHHLDDQLIPVVTETSLARIQGFVGKPESARRRGALQYLFVNGRFMRHPYFHKAILNCYEQLVPEGTQPNYFLVFNVDPETIDVNIHPTKTEIKFENEVPIFQILSAAVKEALGRYNIVPSIDFDMSDAPLIPAAGTAGDDVNVPAAGIDPSYNPFEEDKTQPYRPQASGPARFTTGGGPSYRPAVPRNWEDLYRDFSTERDAAIGQSALNLDVPDAALPPQEQEAVAGTLFSDRETDGLPLPCLQIDNSYIVTPVQDGMLLIDQHRAHLTILYNEYMTHLEDRPLASQSVLFPEVLHLTPAHNTLMSVIEPQLVKLGFNLSRLSGADWSINGTPAGLDGIDIKELLIQVLDTVTRGSGNADDEVYGLIAMTVASRAALPRGQRLTDDEMRSLVARLMKLDSNRYTPQGKPVMTTLGIEQIAKLF